MTAVRHSKDNVTKWMRLGARVLMIIAIVFWLWFGIGSAASEGLGAINWLLHILAPAGLFTLATLLAWRWPGIGGALLTLEGLLALAFVVRTFLRGTFSAATFTPMLLSLAFPPLAAGILFLLCWRQSRPGGIS
ncbi:MAG: hypothetical protein H8E47_10965 [Anaerolineales bacterium]|nr:hypothetical protein [Anaerolineales bacterium]